MATLVDLSQWLGDLANKIEPQQTELQFAAENQSNRIKERTAQGVSVELKSLRHTHQRPTNHLRST